MHGPALGVVIQVLMLFERLHGFCQVVLDTMF